MKVTMTEALLCVSMMLVPSSAIARKHAVPNGQAITVTAEVSPLQQWTNRVSTSLADHLSYPTQFGREDMAQGGVRISFHSSQAGIASGVIVVQSSQSAALDRAALYAVSHISTLYPLPEGVDNDRSMEAWVFFADDEMALSQMKAEFGHQAALTANIPKIDRQASLPPIIFASR